MKKFKKILCPYDFSEYAEEALLYAIKLADEETLISVLNIIQLPYAIDPNGFPYFEVTAGEIKSKTEEALHNKIDSLKQKHHELKFDFLIEEGNEPAELILKVQRNGGYEIVIMGSHGRKGLGRLLLGSVSESVLREALCPVLIVKTTK